MQDAATLNAVTAALAPRDAPIIAHLSAHGTHDPLYPDRSALLLADGELSLAELRRRRLRPDHVRLVMASACESGLGGIQRAPEEFIGLPAGLLEAGAAGVVASYWPVDEAAALLAAWKLYRLWRGEEGPGGLAPGAALARAQAWLRDVTNAELCASFPDWAKNGTVSFVKGAKAPPDPGRAP